MSKASEVMELIQDLENEGLLSKVRNAAYKVGRVLGTVQMVEDVVTNPKKAVKRYINKQIGRKVVSKLYVK